MNNVDDLIMLNKGIKDYIDNDDELSVQYYNLLHEFRTNPSNSDIIFSNLLSLFDYNRELQEKIRILMLKFRNSEINTNEETINFIRFVTTSYKMFNIKVKISNLTALLSENLISAEVIEEWFIRFFPEIPISRISPQIHHLSWTYSQFRHNFSHSLSKGFPIISLLPEKFYPSRFHDYPLEIKFIVAASVLNESTETQASIFKLLKLYGSQVISAEIASEWMSKIDPFLSKIFDELLYSREPLSLYPSNILELFYSYMADAQVEWAIGKFLTNLMTKAEKLKYICPLAAVAENKDKKVKEEVNVDISEALYLSDIKANGFYRSSKQILSQKTIPKSILIAIYGEAIPKTTNEQQNEILSGIALSHILKYGKESCEFDKQFNLEMESCLDCQSPLWRAQYKLKMSKASALRAIIMAGKYETKYTENSIKIAKECLLSISSRKDDVEFACSHLLNHIEQSILHVSEDAALAAFYFFEFARIIELCHRSQVYSLSSFILEREPPYKEFGNSPVCNADIVVKRFMASLGNILKKGFENCINENPAVMFMSGDRYCFKLVPTDSGTSIVHIINPFVVHN